MSYIFAEIGTKSIKKLILERPLPIQATNMVPADPKHHELDIEENFISNIKDEYPNEGETQNLIESMEKYMQ